MILILFISSFQDSASLIAKTWVLSCLATHEATLTKMLLDEKSSPLCLRPIKSLLKCRGVSKYCFRNYTNILGQKLFRTFHQCAYNNMMYAYIHICNHENNVPPGCHHNTMALWQLKHLATWCMVSHYWYQWTKECSTC